MAESGDAAEDVFDISNKERNPEALLRWRVSQGPLWLRHVVAKQFLVPFNRRSQGSSHAAPLSLSRDSLIPGFLPGFRVNAHVFRNMGQPASI